MGISDVSEWSTATFCDVLNCPKMTRSRSVAELRMISRAWSPCVARMTWSNTSERPSSLSKRTRPSASLVSRITVVLSRRWLEGKPFITLSMYVLDPAAMVSHSGRAEKVESR